MFQNFKTKPLELYIENPNGRLSTGSWHCSGVEPGKERRAEDLALALVRLTV
ncbi:hypothetical protein TSUD_61540 [Trifolium subterraneum]|uniref:Uncharacterized protein n=1 Tax=Trifolium subterraneum TaxID=3900 RepID=A0A2Z6NVJ0_TRISU|nr:hypothetical protein TSUD_61540 [Trifolium subterraneum]